MIAKAIDKILTLAQPVVLDVMGEKYSTCALHRIDAELRAEPICVSTLTSLVSYIRSFKENWADEPLLVNVVSPTRVELTSALDADRKREKLMVVEAVLPEFPFDRYINNEKMLIMVQSMFVDDETTHKALVLKFAGTVTSGSVTNYGDDGVSQKATIKYGVASKAEAKVPSPCILRPYRTFLEVEQPASQFVFRMKEENGVSSALFEADGGMWKLEAMRNIRKYLAMELGDRATVIS